MLDLTTLVVVGASFAIAAIVWVLVVRAHAKRANYDKWQPALEPKSTIGTDYPQGTGTFLSGMVQTRYEVPKEDQAHAKTFVPPEK
jgi:hypothetical protein